jgi:hypothetical protein
MLSLLFSQDPGNPIRELVKERPMLTGARLERFQNQFERRPAKCSSPSPASPVIEPEIQLPKPDTVVSPIRDKDGNIRLDLMFNEKEKRAREHANRTF